LTKIKDCGKLPMSFIAGVQNIQKESTDTFQVGGVGGEGQREHSG
jgi:hypothetical protein